MGNGLNSSTVAVVWMVDDADVWVETPSDFSRQTWDEILHTRLVICALGPVNSDNLNRFESVAER